MHHYPIMRMINLIHLAQMIHALVNVDVNTTTILSVGDWGSAALGGYHLKNAQDTAIAMQTYVKEYNPSLVLNTGDNFYYCGIQNGSDPQINDDFVGLFGSIRLPWYSILGNHDYGFNPDAQLWLNQTIPTWIMDSRYYHRRAVLRDSGIVLNVIALDTNPCVADYRGDDRAKWDPCGIQYPTCEPVPDPCRFHENIVQQDCGAQLAWFRSTLDSIDADNEWVFVLGHHKANEINVENFQALISDPRVHLYLNGHTHNLEHYSIRDDPKYITTGAGGMVIIGHQDQDQVQDQSQNQSHTAKSIWLKVVTGFTSHTFIADGTVITEFWDTDQHVLHNFTTSHPSAHLR
jgi:tartrate-resistant acid phosphatase type 5